MSEYTSIYENLGKDIDAEIDELNKVITVKSRIDQKIDDDITNIENITEGDFEQDVIRERSKFRNDDSINREFQNLPPFEDNKRLQQNKDDEILIQNNMNLDEDSRIENLDSIKRRSTIYDDNPNLLIENRNIMKFNDVDETYLIDKNNIVKKENINKIPYEDNTMSVYLGDNPFPDYTETFDVNFYSFVNFKTTPTPDKVLEVVRKFKVDFPYKRHQFINGPGEFYDRLLETNISWDVTPYRIIEKTSFPYTMIDVNITDSYAGIKPKEIYMSDATSVSTYDETVNPITDYFIENSRTKARRQDKRFSIYEAWVRDDNYIKILAGISLERFGKVNPYTLRESMYSTTKLYSECPGERSSFLLALYRHLLGNLSNPKIFDACGGYGDRLLAAMAFGADYTGVEPNSMSKSGFDEMIKMFGNSDRHKMLLDFMPQAEIKDINFDLSFMSPPSYDSEIYSEDKEQSVNMYSNRNEWLKGFLFPTIDKCIRLLGKNRPYVIQSILANEINSYIRIRYPNLTFLGAISVRTAYGRNKPMWIWLKKNIKINRKIPNINNCLKAFDPEIQEYIQKLGYVK